MRLAEFVVASTIIEITPGPNMSYLMSVALTRGVRPALSTIIGIATGLAVIGIVAALGLADFLERYSVIVNALRWGGIIFMLWLAYDAWRNAGHDSNQTKVKISSFRRGLTTNLLNPKLFVFYLAVLPGFIDVTSGNLLFQNLVLVTAYVAIATLIHIGIVIITSIAGRTVLHEGNKAFLGKLMAGLLAAVAIWMFFETR